MTPLLIDTDHLARHLAQPDYVVFDCRFDLADTGRGERDYAQGHIPGARYAHVDRDLSGPITAESGRHPLPDPARLCRWLGRNGVGDGVRVVAYDDSGGNMAVRLWWLLRWLGHATVALLDGGWQAWAGAGLATDAALPAARTVRFSGTPDPTLWVTSDQVEANLKTGKWLLLDARTGERFRGENEPIDPVAGHIPGARSHPLQDNLGPDGRFLSGAELAAAYRRSIAGYPPDRVVCLCGSGVTACHDIFAMELAGLPGARLYAGSWSEWIRDPRRPVAVGDA
jgi:thiosulfate/3-mercaptopyruvate sulfurtransferase